MLHQTLARKVIVMALIFFGLFLIAISFIISNILSIRDATSYLGGITAQQVELSGAFNTDMFRGFAEALSYTYTRAPENRTSAMQEMHDAKEILDELEKLQARPDPAAPGLEVDLAEIQQRRSEVYQVLEPKISGLLDAVDAQDERAINNALVGLSTPKQMIELLEEDSGTLAERSIAAANTSISVRINIALLNTIISLLIILLLATIIIIVVQRQIVAPIKHLAYATRAVADGDLSQLIMATSSDEIGDLQGAFSEMVQNLASNRLAVNERQQALEEQTRQLERTLHQLHESIATRDQLNTTVRLLGSPVIPVFDGTLVMPLIGVIDTERAELMMEALLSAIPRYNAQYVILDVTGVPMIDSQVSRVLIQAAQASRLMGTQTILVGLRPDLAEMIVGLGIDLQGLMTHADLQSGISYVLRQRTMHQVDA
ncbi:MAG: HAMP domain-containing protein [Oscillochloris sp.]|nr:HAMP domain-containing protein [Oscillochloris sp.]